MTTNPLAITPKGRYCVGSNKGATMKYTPEKLETMQKAAPDMLEALEDGQAIINRLLDYLFFKTDKESLILLDELNQQSAVNNKVLKKS
jgi:hypothetical protein